MKYYSSKREIGSATHKLFFILLFYILWRLFGKNILDDLIIAIISIAAYDITGIFLRLIGVWYY